MERFKDISTEELEKRVNERQQFVEKIMAFVADITQLIGEMTQFSETSSYSTFTKEVIGFRNFSFRHHSSWGTDVTTVWHHPQIGKIKLDMTTPVLKVDGKDDKKKCEVEIFIEEKEWQTALLNVIERKDELLSQRKKAEEERQERFRLQTEEERKRSQLIKDTERLKL